MRRTITALLLSALAALALVFSVPNVSEGQRFGPRPGYNYRQYYRPYYGGYNHYYPRYYGNYPRFYGGVQVYRYPHYYGGNYYHPHGGVAAGPLYYEFWH